MTCAIFATIPAAVRDDFNAALSAVKGEQYAFIRRVTDDLPATISSPLTAWAMYDDTANPADAALYSSCKAGNFPEVDQKNGNPIGWGEDGLIALVDAEAAFAQLEYWLNDSEMSPSAFATMIMAQQGIDYIPDDI